MTAGPASPIVTVLPRNRPTPIALPMAIIVSCREVRRRCSPSSVTAPGTLARVVATVLLDRHVESGSAERTAIHGDGGRVTYGELQRLTNRIGHALRTLGIEPGDRVAMRFVNGPQFAATWLAVQKIGAIGVSTMPM